MKSLASWLFVALGIGLGSFSANVAINGAEPRLPAASAAVEGVVLEGETLRSPVGEPFLYGEVRIQDADNTQSNVGTIHWRGAFGEPRIRVRTARGERSVVLGDPSRWHVLPEAEASRQVAALGNLPIVAGVEVGERLSPPFRITVRAVRAGDSVVVATDPGARVPLYLGTRAQHASAREGREAGRWPIVIVLAILAVSSLFVAKRLRSAVVLEAATDDELDASTGARS